MIKIGLAANDYVLGPGSSNVFSPGPDKEVGGFYEGQTTSSSVQVLYYISNKPHMNVNVSLYRNFIVIFGGF